MQKRIGSIAGCVIVAAIAYAAYNHFTAASGRVEVRGALTIELPSGSHHNIDEGIDTWVGRIRLGGTRTTLDYDIGHLAGTHATYAANGPFVSTKQEVNDGVVLDYSLKQEDDHQMLFVSFPELGPANFSTEIHDPSQIDAILVVMRTVRPMARESAGESE